MFIYNGRNGNEVEKEQGDHKGLNWTKTDTGKELVVI